jgi:hypothetical protein
MLADGVNSKVPAIRAADARELVEDRTSVSASKLPISDRCARPIFSRPNRASMRANGIPPSLD